MCKPKETFGKTKFSKRNVSRENMDTGCRDGLPPISGVAAATMGFAMCGAAAEAPEAEPEAGDHPPIHRRPNVPTRHLLNSSCHMTPKKSEKLKSIEINQISGPQGY